MKPVRLILIPELSADPAPFMTIGEGGRVLERGVLHPDAVERPHPLRTVAIAPGADVLMRWIDLPAGGEAQQRAAALWSLKDAVAAPAERLSLALGPRAPEGQPRLTAVVGTALLDAWLDYLTSLGTPADAIIPDALVLGEPEEGDALLAAAFGTSIALRGRRFAASVQPDLVEAVAAGRPVLTLPPEAVEAQVISAVLNPPVDLLSSRARPTTGWRDWRRAAAMAAVLLVSPVVLTAAAALRDGMQADRYERESRAVVAAAAPDLAQDADPAASLRRRAEAALPPGGAVVVSAALFNGVESVAGADLDILVADPETGVRATVTHAAAEDARALDNTLRAQGFVAEQTAALEENGRLVSDITVRTAR